MAIQTPSNIKQRWQEVKNETVKGKNTAQRVGSIGEDTFDTLHSLIPPLANNLTTTTPGSALDAVQGKILNDKINSIVIPPATSQPFFQIGKRNGFIIVWGDPEIFEKANAESPIKIKVFRHQKGGVTEFHRDRNFEFNLTKIQTGKTGDNVPIYKYAILRNSTEIRQKFLGIVKHVVASPLHNNSTGYLIGKIINPLNKKGKFGFCTKPPQDKNNFTLSMALWQNNKIISNPVRIFAYYIGDNLSVNINNIRVE